MSIGIVDTTVLCNVLRVPGKDQETSRALDELRRWIRQGTSLLLPLTTIYETGNHIAQAAEFHRQCRLHPSRRVFIWSYDRHLAAFDRQVGGGAAR